MTKKLPDGFESLEKWVGAWALATLDERWEKRRSSTKEELLAFYAALQPEIERILDHCDKYPVGQLQGKEARLFGLALMLAEVAPNVECYDGEPKVPYSFEERRLIASIAQNPY